MEGGTALREEIAARVRASGPLTVADYMTACLAHPRYGYYMTRDPLGAAGDFTTAPEISQMFGELIGLWAADCWMRLGGPAPLHLVELGPGRGTLMADSLRAAHQVPDFMAAIRVHLVELSPVLHAAQERLLAASPVPVAWHADFNEIPPGPMIVIANEFLDALPVRQFERAAGGWTERIVILDPEGLLAFGPGDPEDTAGLPLPREAPSDVIAEWSPAREAAVRALATRFLDARGAALFIDYGYAASGFGDTLQAVRGHRAIGVLDAPGESDLTAHVDFAALVHVAREAGAATYGPIEMGRFLRALGITERAARLRAANPGEAASIDAALARLTDPDRMGSLFKVLALTSPGAPPPEPFAAS